MECDGFDTFLGNLFYAGKETAFQLYLHIKLPYALTSNPNVLVILSPSTSVVCNT